MFCGGSSLVETIAIELPTFIMRFTKQSVIFRVAMLQDPFPYRTAITPTVFPLGKLFPMDSSASINMIDLQSFRPDFLTPRDRAPNFPIMFGGSSRNEIENAHFEL